LPSNPASWPPRPRDGRGRRVLFINPPSVPYNVLRRSFEHRFAPLVQTIAMPMGILYLASTLERDLPGARVRIVDLARQYREDCDRGPLREASFEEFVAETLVRETTAHTFTPDFVGISILFSTAHKSTLRIAEVCRRLWPNATIVAGGMHATNTVESLLECKAIDYVCRGEAESIIADLVLLPGEHIPGVVGRKKPPPYDSAPLVYDLDTIPLPAWHLLPMEEYVRSDHSRARAIDRIDQDGEATIVTTRGCPFRCTFCASWTVHGREMRYRSVENVLAELRILTRRYRVESLIPEDDLFSVKKPRFLALCRAITDEFGGRLHFQFPNGLSVATLDAEVIAVMAGMGMTVANIAIESGSDVVQRKIIKKNVNLEHARQVVQSCRDQGVVTRAYFILGFPGETREQMLETIVFAASLPADWSVFNIAAPLVGTEMYAQLLERREIDHTFNWDDAFFHERSYDTPEIGASDLKDLAYGANLRVNFFENYNLRCGNWARAADLYRDVLRTYPGHLAAQLCLGEALQGAGDLAGAEEAFATAREILLREEPLAVGQVARFPAFFPGADIRSGAERPPGPILGTPKAARTLM
jgi:anaerobic magnesium-protoporphyrin IX monomethyl ester cyclase